MQANEFAIMDRAVEEGIAAGYRRAHKHTDKPSEQVLKESIFNAVMSEICEFFFFESPFEDDEDEEGDEPGEDWRGKPVLGPTLN